MNRRSFFKFGAAAAALASKLPSLLSKQPEGISHLKQATRGRYVCADGRHEEWATVRCPLPLHPDFHYFQIDYREVGKRDWIVALEVCHAADVRIDGLVPGVEYEFRVRTVCADGRIL